MKNTKFIYFFFACIISIQWSCSVNDSLVETQEQIDKESNRFGKFSPSDLKTIIIDGETVNNMNRIDIESRMKNAHSVHFDYVNRELVISSNKEAFKKYLASDPEFIMGFEEARREALSKDNEVFGEETTSGTGRNLHSNLPNYSNHGIFAYHRTSSTDRMYIYEAPDIADLSTGRVTKQSFSESSADLDDPTPNTLYYKINFELFKVRANHSGHKLNVKNTSNSRTLYLVFYSGVNYTGTLNWTSLPKNSHTRLTSSQVSVNNTDAKSLLSFLW